MKVSSILIGILFISTLLASNDVHTFVKQLQATGFVNDYANLLSTSNYKQLEQKIAAINDTTSIQFAVVTLTELADHKPKAVAEAIGNHWGVGQKNIDNGIVLLASVRERAIHIALGERVDDYLEDAYVKTLIKEVVKPAFQKGNYAQGINDAIEKIYLQLRHTNIDQSHIGNCKIWLGLGSAAFIILTVAMALFVWKSKN